MTHPFDSTNYNKQFHPELTYFVYRHPHTEEADGYGVYYGNQDKEISEWQIIAAFLNLTDATNLVVKLINTTQIITVGENYYYKNYFGPEKELVRAVRIEFGMVTCRIYQDGDIEIPSSRHITCIPIELTEFIVKPMTDEEAYFGQFS